MTADTASAIASITAYARAGAVDHAWRLFAASGLADRRDDPAALSLHGRLLKDRALAARGSERRRLSADAGAAYAAAARLRPATYPLINAATLALIAGDAGVAAARAGEVMTLLDSAAEPDTPWWQAATRAEALLLMGRGFEARAALHAALALAPRAWEDHAVTLRQFRTIIAEQGGDPAWLDDFRPPRHLHFAGPMQLDGDGAGLIPEIDTLLAAENIGCGHGALAAGADLLIAERLLRAGAELDILLPGGEAAFIEKSVRPFGAGALRRFEMVMGAAASVRGVGDPAAFALAIVLADEVAMGEAVMCAESLQTEAVQLVIGSADAGRGGNAARVAGLWRQAGRRQHLLAARAAEAPVPPLPPGDATPAGVVLAALVAVSLAAGSEDLAGALAHLPGRLPLPAVPQPELAPRMATADGALLAFATPQAAAAAALVLRDRLMGSGPVRIACHYGEVLLAPTPMGPLVGATLALVSATADTGIVISENLVAALRAGPAMGVRSEFIGELRLAAQAEPMRLHALKAIGSL